MEDNSFSCPLREFRPKHQYAQALKGQAYDSSYLSLAGTSRE
jgi:hypothetical protein